MSATRTSAAAVRSLLRRAEDALSQWDWEAAGEYAVRALAADPKNADAHLLAFLATRHITSVAELPGVAAQIVLQTPPRTTPLAQVLDEDVAQGGPAHDTTRELLREHPGIVVPVSERLSNLRAARGAFEAVFFDEDWQVALEWSSLERTRAMQRAQEEAGQVFDDALCEARDEVARECAVAEMRLPRVAKVTREAEAACARVLQDLDRTSEDADTAVSKSYSFLRGNIRIARIGLWVGMMLVAGAVAMFVLALVPHGTSTTTNVLASFDSTTVLVALGVLAAGIVLLALRGSLVRSNRRALRERVETRADVHERVASRVDELEGEVASVRAACRALEALSLTDDAFEDAVEELAASVAVLSGAKAEPQEAASVAGPERDATTDGVALAPSAGMRAAAS